MSVSQDFAQAMFRLWVRDGIVVEEAGNLAGTIANHFSEGDQGSQVASGLLESTGVRAKWNDILRLDRAQALAKRIRPFVSEPMLDVLSGDGSVSLALSDFGVKTLTATERPGEYAASVLPASVSFVPFTDDLDFSQFRVTTALISTVLHHEPDPVRLLNALAQSTATRWIIVENCVTPQYSRPFHQFADRFFNECLNEFDVSCVEQHRTLDEWIELLKPYGTVTVIEDCFDVPGIPFPYSLFLVSR